MVKRPMYFLLGAYLLGLSFIYLPFWGVLILIILLIILLYYIFFHIRINTPILNNKDKILFFIPIFILLGYIRQKDSLVVPLLEDKFDQSIVCSVEGKIESIESGKENLKIKLVDCKVIVETSKTTEIINNTKSNEMSELFYSDSLKVSNSEIYQCDAILVYIKEGQDYQVGNRIQVSGELTRFRKPTNPGQFDEEKYYKMYGYDYKVYAKKAVLLDDNVSNLHHLLQQVKDKFVLTYKSILPEKEAGIINAMLLGDKATLDEDIKTLYQKNGIAHILAISGLHVTIVGMAIFRLFQTLGLGMKSSSILSVVMILLYGILTGFSVSTNRAVVMLILTLIAKVIGKTYDVQTALSMAALIILIQNPLHIQNVGFLLSFGAIIGIVYVGPALQILIPTKIKIINTIIVSTGIQIATLPIILNSYYEVPIFSIIINLFVIPCMSLLVVIAMIGGVIGMTLPSLGQFLMGCAYYVLKLYEILCNFFEGLPNSVLRIGKPSLEVIFFYYVILILFLILIHKLKKRLLGVILILLLVIFYRKPNPGIRITLLDVGQGDSIYLETKSGTTYLVDGGSTSMKKVGQYRILPFLKSMGVETLDYVFVTHSDADHMNGILELMEDGTIPILYLVLPHIENKGESYVSLEELAISKGISILYMKQEDVIVDGEVLICCLHPTIEYKTKNTNETSLVLSVELNEFQLLLTGDIEGRGENLLLSYLREHREDMEILKVSHHGSKNSTPSELLNIITPEIALISAGEGNSYGHPHDELLERLQEADSKIYTTTNSGAIEIETNGEWIKIKEFYKRK